MKARQHQSLNQRMENMKQMWPVILKAMCDNRAATVITLHNEFGFGANRIRRLISAVYEFNKKSDLWREEGIFDDKIREELEAMGMDYEEVYVRKMEDYDDFVHAKKVRHESVQHVRANEARVIQDTMFAVRAMHNESE